MAGEKEFSKKDVEKLRRTWTLIVKKPQFSSQIELELELPSQKKLREKALLESYPELPASTLKPILKDLSHYLYYNLAQFQEEPQRSRSLNKALRFQPGFHLAQESLLD